MMTSLLKRSLTLLRGNVIIKRLQIVVSDQPVEVIYKDIKNLHLSVHPPDGQVRVSAPLRLDDEAVRLAVVSRLGWIRTQQQKLAIQDRQSQREMITGESHFFMGQRYRLELRTDGPTGVRITRSGILQLSARPSADREGRERLLREWYRQQLKLVLPQLVAKWEVALGVDVAYTGIKRMKTRWGTCNPTARRVWVNLELAKKSPLCIEYVLVHEMIHLSATHHDDKFHALMDQHLPQWRLLRDELNRAPLAHENWGY